MKVVLLGATRGMGRALARLVAERGDEIFLLGRDATDLAQAAKDLEIRGAKGGVGSAHCDLLEPEGFAPALDRAVGQLGRLDTVVVTAGLFATQEALEADHAFRDRMLAVNFASTVAFCEEARARLVSGGGGVLCVFSSAAGDRDRRPVILYGATKAGLNHYLLGLDLKFRAAGLRVVIVKPGFVRTSMTQGLPEPPFAAEPEDAARAALRGIDRRRQIVYAPPIWRWVMLAVRSLPRALMRRASF